MASGKSWPLAESRFGWVVPDARVSWNIAVLATLSPLVDAHLVNESTRQHISSCIEYRERQAC